LVDGSLEEALEKKVGLQDEELKVGRGSQIEKQAFVHLV
jgi:hypothetical protein